MRTKTKTTISNLLLLIMLMVFGGIILIPRQPPYGILAWVVLVLISLYMLVRRHAETTSYICLQCRHVFKLSTTQDLLGLQGINAKKYLKCPHCSRRQWIKEYDGKDQ